MLKIIAEGSNGTYTIAQLLKIMAALRSPGGCPWDIEQTHKSIRNDAIEEVYEVADAIDNNDTAALCEELGDMLLQVVFHSRIAEEEGTFDFNRVVDGIAKKLILRHPHVFGEEQVETSGQVLDLWDNIKKKEKNQETFTETLNSVPKAFPALMRASKVQKRAVKAGVAPTNVLLDKSLSEAVLKLENAVALNNSEDIYSAYANLLFKVAGLQQTLKINCEEALNSATNDFIERFSKAEENGSLSNFNF